MSGRRVLVCGGRSFGNAAWLRNVLDAEHRRDPIGVVIHGGAEGADSLAGKWALRAGLVVVVCVADWVKHGRSAGPIRNQRMLDECAPDAVIAFPGQRGTADMVRRAKLSGVPVLEVRP